MNKLVRKLSKTKAPKDAKNPWDFSCKGNAIRRKNLEGYFAKMAEIKPSVLLVGEAPGYRGCGRVGMPFSSEKLVLSHPFFSDKSTFGIENEGSPMAEASATIVWKTFDSLGFYPLMWATYPFHPHEPNDPFSNRAPRSEEVALGKEFIEDVLSLFEIKHLVAVGRVAERCLTGMGYEVHAVRHPSRGGATMFAKGLEDFVSRNRIVRRL